MSLIIPQLLRFRFFRFTASTMNAMRISIKMCYNFVQKSLFTVRVSEQENRIACPRKYEKTREHANGDCYELEQLLSSRQNEIKSFNFVEFYVQHM